MKELKKLALILRALGITANDCDDFQISVSGSFYHISDNEGETWDNFDIVEQELK